MRKIVLIGVFIGPVSAHADVHLSMPAPPAITAPAPVDVSPLEQYARRSGPRDTWSSAGFGWAGLRARSYRGWYGSYGLYGSHGYCGYGPLLGGHSTISWIGSGYRPMTSGPAHSPGAGHAPAGAP